MRKLIKNTSPLSFAHTQLSRITLFNEAKVFPVLTVVQLHPDNQQLPPLREDDAKNKVLWKIVADPAATDSTLVESIERIEYGKVPKGFIQKVPQEGQPPSLAENQTYEAVGPLSLMRNAAVRFKIANGKIVVLTTPE